MIVEATYTPSLVKPIILLAEVNWRSEGVTTGTELISLLFALTKENNTRIKAKQKRGIKYFALIILFFETSFIYLGIILKNPNKNPLIFVAPRIRLNLGIIFIY
ncbi:MAG: hypothetical protein WCG28_02630 [bacterium]